MKTELRFLEHAELPDALVCELWYAGQFIGAVYGSDGPGVRIITKHKASIYIDDTMVGQTVKEIRIDPSKLANQ